MVANFFIYQISRTVKLQIIHYTMFFATYFSKFIVGFAALSEVIYSEHRKLNIYSFLGILVLDYFGKIIMLVRIKI